MDTYAARNKKRRWDKKQPEQKQPPCATCRPGLHPGNFLAVTVYSRCCDQWRYSGETGTMTIDNANVEAAMRAAAVDRKQWPDVFDDVKTIIGEIAGLIGNEQQKQREKAKEKRNGPTQDRSHRRR